MREGQDAVMAGEGGASDVVFSRRIVIGGAGGHGVLVFGRLLALAGIRRYGEATFVPVYDPEIHGSPVNAFVIVSEKDIVAPVSNVYDIGVLFDHRSAHEHAGKVRADGLLVVNSSIVSSDFIVSTPTVWVPATAEALRLGNSRLSNMFMLGAVLRATGLFTVDEIVHGLTEVLPAHRRDLIPQNVAAIEAGFSYADDLAAGSAEPRQPQVKRAG